MLWISLSYINIDILTAGGDSVPFLKSQSRELRWFTFSNMNCTVTAGHHTLCGSGTSVGHLGRNCNSAAHGLFAGGGEPAHHVHAAAICEWSSNMWEVWAGDTLHVPNLSHKKAAMQRRETAKAF